MSSIAKIFKMIYVSFYSFWLFFTGKIKQSVEMEEELKQEQKHKNKFYEQN